MTFGQILADIYRRTGFETSPATDVVTRIKGFVNETQQELFREPGMEFLQNDVVTFVSVANQQSYGLPLTTTRVKILRDATTRIEILPMSLAEYRDRYPDPAAVTGIPTRYVDLGFDAVLVEPADASTIYVVGGASDTGTAYIEGIRDNGYPFTDSVAMTGVTAVAFPTYTDIVSITKFYLSTAAVGTVVLHEDSGAGATLSVIPKGVEFARYRRIALAPTPASAITYYADIERTFTDLVNDTDEPMLPVKFHHILTLGGRYKEYEKASDGRYGVAKGEFDKAVKKLKFWFYQSAVGLPNMRGSNVQAPSLSDGGTFGSATGGSTVTPLPATSGGTGFASYAVGDMLYANTTSTLAKLADTVAGRPLMSQGVGVAPAYDTNPNFSGNVTVTGTLHAVGAATLDSTAVVTGALTASSTLHAVGAVTNDSTLLQTGASTFVGLITFATATGSGLVTLSHATAPLLVSGASAIVEISGATAPEIEFSNTSVAGRISANKGLILDIDRDNNETDRTLIVRKNSATTVLTVAEDGTLTPIGLLDLSGAAAGQIKFTAAQNASSDVNTLDDYEEGSWTPVIGGSGGTTGQTYAANGQVGRYRKIGKTVICDFRVELSAKGTITGNVEIQGLPFTSDTATNLIPGTCALGFIALATNWVNVIARSSANTLVAPVSGCQAAATTNVTALTTTDIGNTSIFFGTLVYQASA